MTGSFAAITLFVTASAAVRGTWSPCGLSMISAINPIAERGRGYRYSLTAAWFILGSLAGGALLGGAASVIAWLLRGLGQPAAALIAVLGCLIVLAADLRVGGFALPTHPRQVNERWLTDYRRWLYAAGFGLQIGCGFATYIMTAATYLLVLLAMLSGSATFALAVGLSFGLVRGSAVLLSSRCRHPQSLRTLHRRLHRWEPASLRQAVVVEAIAAVLLGRLAAGWPAALAAAVSAVALLVLANSAGRLRRFRSRLASTQRLRPRRPAPAWPGHRTLPRTRSAAGTTGVPPRLADSVVDQQREVPHRRRALRSPRRVVGQQRPRFW